MALAQVLPMLNVLSPTTNKLKSLSPLDSGYFDTTEFDDYYLSSSVGQSIDLVLLGGDKNSRGEHFNFRSGQSVGGCLITEPNRNRLNSKTFIKTQILPGFALEHYTTDNPLGYQLFIDYPGKLPVKDDFIKVECYEHTKYGFKVAEFIIRPFQILDIGFGYGALNLIFPNDLWFDKSTLYLTAFY